MRKFMSMAAALILLTVLATPAFSQANNEKNRDSDQPKIEGSGKVITRMVPTQPFDQLEAHGVFNVSLTQGDKESVSIEADDNLQDLFEVKSDGGKLVVQMKENQHFRTKKKMIVHISFKQLKAMNLRTVGNVTCDGNLNFGDLSLTNTGVGMVDLSLNAQKLSVENRSVGNLRLRGKAEEAVIRCNSVGSLNAGDLVVQTMDIDNNGVGSAEVNAAKELRVSDSFLSRVKNVGNTNVKKIRKVII